MIFNSWSVNLVEEIDTLRNQLKHFSKLCQLILLFLDTLLSWNIYYAISRASKHISIGENVDKCSVLKVFFKKVIYRLRFFVWTKSRI